MDLLLTITSVHWYGHVLRKNVNNVLEKSVNLKLKY